MTLVVSTVSVTKGTNTKRQIRFWYGPNSPMFRRKSSYFMAGNLNCEQTIVNSKSWREHIFITVIMEIILQKKYVE